jgi:hypothetical protein
MFSYQAVPYVPVFGRNFVRSLGQEAAPAAPPSAPAPSTSALSPGFVKTAVAGARLLETAIYGAGTWVGIYTGQKAHGLLSVLGWGIGILSGVAAAGSAVGFILWTTKGMPIPSRTARPATTPPSSGGGAA